MAIDILGFDRTARNRRVRQRSGDTACVGRVVRAVLGLDLYAAVAEGIASDEEGIVAFSLCQACHAAEIAPVGGDFHVCALRPFGVAAGRQHTAFAAYTAHVDVGRAVGDIRRDFDVAR